MLNRHTLLSTLVTVALAVWATGVVFVQQDPELATTVDDGFTIATVGDLIYAHDLGHMMTDPSFAAVVELLRDADVATGNLEGIIVDGRNFTGARMGGHGAEPGAADSIRDMGFDLVARPNNHGNDFGPEGVTQTSAHLDRVGVQYAGVGNTYAAARAARFYTAGAGRVGMVATTATGTLPARPARGEWPGVGGYSTLDVTRFFMMPPASWPAVRTIRDNFPNGAGFYARGANTDDHIQILGEHFRKASPGATEPYYAFEMNQRDLRDLLAAVREGKMRSDFLTVAIHSHHFRDTRGGYRGPGIPKQSTSTPTRALPTISKTSPTQRSTRAPTRSREPGYTWCAALRSTRTGPSSTDSVSSCGNETWTAWPDWASCAETPAMDVRFLPSMKVSSRSARSAVAG